MATKTKPKPEVKVERVLARGSIEGRIFFMRSEDKRAHGCICCDGAHVFCRAVDWKPWETFRPEHLGNDAGVLVDVVATDHDEYEGKRVRVTVEVLDDEPEEG